MGLFKYIVDYREERSIASYFRKKRFKLYSDIIDAVGKESISILDVGGTEIFWEKMGFANTRHKIIILNLKEELAIHKNIRVVSGDARCMPQYGNKRFDLVFSNSVIEHVGGTEDQNNMAKEIKRIGKSYIIQTPNYYFPIEPHFLFPGFQWLSVDARAWLLKYLSLGWREEKIETMEEAREIVKSYQLLKKTDMEKMFPDADIIEEKFLGLVKSLIAVKKFNLGI